MYLSRSRPFAWGRQQPPNGYMVDAQTAADGLLGAWVFGPDGPGTAPAASTAAFPIQALRLTDRSRHDRHISQKVSVGFANGVQWVGDDPGSGLRHYSTGNRLDVERSGAAAGGGAGGVGEDELWDGLTAFTFLMRVIFKDVGASHGHTLFARDNGGSDKKWGWTVGSPFGCQFFQNYQGGAGTNDLPQGTAFTITVDRVYNLAMTKALTSYAFFRDERTDGTATGTISGLVDTFAPATVGFGNVVGPNALNGIILHFYAWSRVLLTEDIFALMRAPYDIFESPRRLRRGAAAVVAGRRHRNSAWVDQIMATA